MLSHTDYGHDERQDIRDAQEEASYARSMAADDPEYTDEPIEEWRERQAFMRDSFDPERDAYRAGQ